MVFLLHVLVTIHCGPLGTLATPKQETTNNVLLLWCLAFSLLPVSVALKTSSKRNQSMNLPGSNNVVFVLL